MKRKAISYFILIQSLNNEQKLIRIPFNAEEVLFDVAEVKMYKEADVLYCW